MSGRVVAFPGNVAPEALRRAEREAAALANLADIRNRIEELANDLADDRLWALRALDRINAVLAAFGISDDDSGLSGAQEETGGGL